MMTGQNNTAVFVKVRHCFFVARVCVTGVSIYPIEVDQRKKRDVFSTFSKYLGQGCLNDVVFVIFRFKFKQVLI